MNENYETTLKGKEGGESVVDLATLFKTLSCRIDALSDKVSSLEKELQVISKPLKLD
ncbi:hypothetical protein [Vibrio cholerae]|uniref:hypothetical protein n=1 Tax=Vibrio cholerae TaxID=666 RepID=UPI00308066CE